MKRLLSRPLTKVQSLLIHSHSRRPASLWSDIFCYVLLPSIFFLSLGYAIEVSHVDLVIAESLYRYQGGPEFGGWTLRSSFLEEGILHKGMHHLVVVLALSLLAAFVISLKRQPWQEYRAPLLYLIVCFAVTTLIIAALKKFTHVNCPWDLVAFGGTQPFVPTFSALPTGVTPGRCFPGGHASGGYGWLGLYFVALVYWPRWRYLALAAVLVCGGLMDIGQQLRGAHFMSHGFWSLAISWWVSSLLYLLMLRRYRVRRA
ncbi:phosphatase PAP2 family protein [Shewanella sp. SNU WT4]|uniref:phosphatase PAP2 family protein n=1 Tax=Shewanella sp. SNU WT4 TaxID=2590015 RepID=UPI00112600E8|nr:phosphatase PAP2 family protein [Shewanella sp. SNU WT4]QDF66625.1 phosphatase PAP2 family protein [Shewanella sp. SNU WT4]